MELSVKKLNRSLKYFIEGRNYQYHPSQFMFDYESDKDYVYIAIEQVYVIRVPKKYMPNKESMPTMVNTDVRIEKLIENLAKEKTHTTVTIQDITELDNKRIVKFTYGGDDEIWINAKFLEQYYNHPVTKYEADNITFSASTTIKSPVIMWKNDEAIAMFLPINHG